MTKRAFAVIWLLTACLPTATYGQAVSENVWYVLERVVPAPASRSDWISVGPSRAQVDGWVIVGPASTWERAVVNADAHRLNDSRFHAVCDRQRYRVVRNIQTRSLAVTATEMSYGYVLERAGLCCEEAYELAFPGVPGSDCRMMQLQSVPGTSVRLTPAGWRALGRQVVLPTQPPTVIPAASLSDMPPGDAGTINVTVATYGASCGAPQNNVTRFVKAVCDGRASCDYRVDHTHIGDPAVGCRKDFQIAWSCGANGGTNRVEVAPEATGKTATLSCPAGR